MSNQDDFVSLSNFLIDPAYVSQTYGSISIDWDYFYQQLQQLNQADLSTLDTLLQTWAPISTLSGDEQANQFKEKILDTDLWPTVEKLITLYYTGVWDPNYQFDHDNLTSVAAINVRSADIHYNQILIWRLAYVATSVGTPRAEFYWAQAPGGAGGQS